MTSPGAWSRIQEGGQGPSLQLQLSGLYTDSGPLSST